MYKNIYYDRQSNTIYEREVGDQEYKKYPYVFKYFMPDATKQSKIRDCFGVPMKQVVVNTKEEMDMYRVLRKKMRLAESDLKPVVKFVHEKYDKATLTYQEYEDYRIAFYDIETQTSRRYPMKTKIRVRPLGSTDEIGREITIYEFEHTENCRKFQV